MQQHSTSELLSATRRLVASGEYAKAYRIVETLYNRSSEEDTDEDRAIILSYYGLLKSRHLRQWDEGKQIAEDALQRQFYLPETYINLARIYMDRPIPPYRRTAERLLKDALKIDPTSRAANAELQKLRGHSVKILSFLSGEHPINKFLAKLLGKG